MMNHEDLVGLLVGVIDDIDESEYQDLGDFNKLLDAYVNLLDYVVVYHFSKEFTEEHEELNQILKAHLEYLKAYPFVELSKKYLLNKDYWSLNKMLNIGNRIEKILIKIEEILFSIKHLA